MFDKFTDRIIAAMESSVGDLICKIIIVVVLLYIGGQVVRGLLF
ncbi:MAG: hypothetical protein ACOX05_04140 [Bacillota bacterium]|jgi:hypothetical protein